MRKNLNFDNTPLHSLKWIRLFRDGRNKPSGKWPSNGCGKEKELIMIWKADCWRTKVSSYRARAAASEEKLLVPQNSWEVLFALFVNMSDTTMKVR